MKKLSLFLVVTLVITCNLLCCAYAEPTTSEVVNSQINSMGETAMDVAQNVLEQFTIWSLPFCAILIVYGAVQYFIMGIRNLYKKRQGLLLMFGSMTFYVIILALDLVITFLLG